MTGTVQTVFAQGLEHVEREIQRVGHFFDSTPADMALRLLLLGLATQKRSKLGPDLTSLANAWNRRVSERVTNREIEQQNKALRGDTAREAALMIGERRLPDVIFAVREGQDRTRTYGKLALCAVLHFEILGEAAAQHNALIVGGLAICDFVHPILRYLKTGREETLAAINRSVPSATGRTGSPEFERLRALVDAEAVDGVAREAARMLVRADRRALAQLAKALFDRPEEEVCSFLDDRSYYVVYRFSTQLIQIVKTFLIVEAPGCGGSGLFTHTHHYRSDQVRWPRQSNGDVLKIGETVYFTAYSREVNTAGKESRLAPPQGMNVLATEFMRLDGDNRLVPAVFLSNALGWHPIVGRAMMVHIGLESQLGGPLLPDKTWSGVVGESRPTEGPLADMDVVRQHLRADLELCCRRGGGTHADDDFDMLTEEVITRINNRAYWARPRNANEEGIIYALEHENLAPSRP